jgi:hypothetical protein
LNPPFVTDGGIFLVACEPYAGKTVRERGELPFAISSFNTGERDDSKSGSGAHRTDARRILIQIGMPAHFAPLWLVLDLTTNLLTAPGGIVHGKLLYGGVTRYRVIGGAGGKGRCVGERTMMAQSGQACESWLQCGGPKRNDDAMEMGP